MSAKINFVDSRQVIASLFRRYRIDESNWSENAKESIARGIELIANRHTLMPCTKEIKAKNYTIKLPCGLKYLEAIIYNNTYLNLDETINRFDTTHKFKLGVDNFTIQFQKITVPCKEDKITFCYYVLPLGEDDWPLIPDIAQVKEFLEWYCLRDVMTTGYPHPVIDYKECEAKVELNQARASNSLKAMSVQQRRNFTDNRSLINTSSSFKDRHFNR